MIAVHYVAQLQRQRPLRTLGFTLIEMMIVVAIIAILAAIAFPSYQQQVRATRRADGQQALVSLASAMERLFTQNNRYDPGGVAPPLGACPTCIFPNQIPIDGGPATYTLGVAVGAAPATTYTLTATPAGPQAAPSDGVLTLTNTGAKTWDEDANAAISASEMDWQKN